MGPGSGTWLWLSTTLKKLGKGGEWKLRKLAYYMIFTHWMGLQGFLFMLVGRVPWQHFAFVLCVGYIIAVIGVGAGAHRLWSHRSYKAKLPLRILLILMQSVSGQGSVIRWSRDHRLHHKYCETDADPHDIRRGFFFSHIGWTLLKKHPKLLEKEKSLDLSDLEGDPVLAFQDKYYLFFELIVNQALLIGTPCYLWNTPLYISICMSYFRFVVGYHLASMGNSVAHCWDWKPYEKSIGPSDVTWLSLLIAGEGWHNFHHVFPWDYRSTDVGLQGLNLSKLFIDLMSKIGWAYDLKTVPDHVIRQRAARTGDGSIHPVANKPFCVEEDSDDDDKMDGSNWNGAGERITMKG